MAIIKKRFGNRVYLYEVVVKRINGKPRIVNQKYLGRADEVTGKLVKKPTAHSARVYEFGAIAALLDIAKEIKFAEVINEVVAKREQGISVGEYILLAALNRAVSPRSKNQLWDWYRSTMLWRYCGYKKKLLRSQRFWDHMNVVSKKDIKEIEARLTENIISKFGIDLRCLIYDATNFHTYINTCTNSTLAQRGHNKQKRDDLRQIGLALMVSREFHIPLFHEFYKGNRADSRQFSSVITSLIKHYTVLSRGCKDITLIFDKGNNSRKNITRFSKGPYHFVGSLVVSHHKDLMAMPMRKYKGLQDIDLEGIEAYRSKKEVFGKTRTVIITFNPKFYKAQLRGIIVSLKKKIVQMRKLQACIKKRKYDAAKIETKVKTIVQGQYIKNIIKWNLVTRGKNIKLNWKIDRQILEKIKRERLGKKILFTDNHHWTTEEIIKAYHGQYKIEHAFKQMKNPFFVSWKPLFHWTDQKIIVHGFYCVMALMLVSLLVKRVHSYGISKNSLQLLSSLSEIKEVEIVYKDKKDGLRSEYILNELSPEGKELFTCLGLNKYRKMYL